MDYELTLCNLVTKAARVVQREYQAAVGTYGITAPQAGLVYFLALAGPCSQSELARLVKLDRATVNAMVRKLEARGLIALARDPEDRRRDVVSLAPAGRDLAPRLVEIDREMGQRYLELAGGPEAAGAVRCFLEAIVFQAGPDPGD